jgi:hypothetical protein
LVHTFLRAAVNGLSRTVRVVPGGLIYNSEMLEISEGITDYGYIATLQQLVDGNIADSPLHPKAEEARRFLSTRKASLLLYAREVKFESPDAAKIVGAPADLPLSELCEKWRRKTAEFIQALEK